MLKKAAVYTVITFLSLCAFSQNQQAEYLEARRLFKAEQFKEAKTAFAQLTTSEVFGKYASFYFALSAYKEGEINTAVGRWKQILEGYPEWREKKEVLFWLAYAKFEQERYSEGLKYALQLSNETVNAEVERALINKYIYPLELEQIKILYESNPDSRVLARAFVRKLNEVPYTQRDFEAIEQLIEQWEFQMEEIRSFDLPENVQKDTYDLAVLLPFLYESLQNTSLIVQNDLVMDMYQGMVLAAEDLAAEGKPVNLFPYDTRRKEEVTRDVLQSDRLKTMDIIIGPLYSGPNAAVNEFSLKHKINTINPLSSNSEVIGGNPLSFLVMPSYKTIARKLAEQAIEENYNKYAMIFYEETERDSVFAAIYKKTIEGAGFEVLVYKGMNRENSKEVIEDLSSQYEVFLTKEEADSIHTLPGRFVRQRRVRSAELRRLERDESFKFPVSYDDDENAIVYYENRFHLMADSIGHVLGATRSNLFANNLISAIESRADSIKLYGYGDWLDFTMLSYDQLERLSVALTYPEYIDRDDYAYQDLVERFRQRYKTNPSLNHFRGYETVWFVGNMLHRHGKYFQQQIRNGKLFEGKVFEGYKYGAGNDNQVVPIVRFKDARLKVVNKQSYEDREK